MDIAKLAIEVDTRDVSAARDELLGLSVSAKGAGANTSIFKKEVREAGKEAKISSYQYRQTAMQLSQVASQGAVTGNYLQALAIQLPDLALGFGALGIVIGAVAGSLAGPLINAVTGSEKSISDLISDIDELSGSFEIAADGTLTLSEELVRLSRVSSEAARLKLRIDTEEAKSALNGVRDQINETLSEGFSVGQFSIGTAGIIESSGLKELINLDLNRFRQTTKLTADELYALGSAADEASSSSDPESYSSLAMVLDDLKSKYGESNETVNILTAGLAAQIPVAIDAATTVKSLSDATDNFDEILKRTSTNAKNLSGAFDFGPSSADYYAEHLRLLKEANAEQLRADSARLASRASALKAIESLEAAQMTQQEKLTDNYLAQQYSISSALAGEFESIESRLMAGVIATQTAEEMKLAAVEEANALKLASDQQYAAASQQIADQQTQAQLAAYATTLSAMQGFSSAALAAVEAYGEESSDLGKGLLLASKVLSVAQAVMAAELSAVMTRAAYASAAMFAGPGAPAVLAAGEAAAQLNRGLGYASAALIAATEFAPARALGGQVQAGTSYLVGERGPELVTMGANGYVTPNDKLGGNSAPVINVIEDASKAGTQEVQQMGEQDIINIFVSNIQRGGAAARAMQGAYGLRRAAR